MACRHRNYIKRVLKPYIIGFRHSVVFFCLIVASGEKAVLLCLFAFC